MIKTKKYTITLSVILFIFCSILLTTAECEEPSAAQKAAGSNTDVSDTSKTYLPKQNNEADQPIKKQDNSAPITPSAMPAQSRTIKTETPAKKESKSSNQTNTLMLVLTKSVMCEAVKGFEPVTSAVVFSISLGKIFCFTSFDNISQNTFVYHKWFHRDRFVATNRFLIKSPQWSTFSTMQLRVADKGPWRVEITDEKDNILKTLRFSVSD